ncbi:uncharacterized protein [Antedon mediterranea]|uniref:uncharacterized protein isoform X2 n=1 Tax=Antedon mediterranea TaxID=105859 RepID=UPI003AF93F8D
MKERDFTFDYFVEEENYVVLSKVEIVDIDHPILNNLQLSDGNTVEFALQFDTKGEVLVVATLSNLTEAKAGQEVEKGTVDLEV